MEDQDRAREFLTSCLLRFGNPIPIQNLIEDEWYQSGVDAQSMHPDYVHPQGATAWVDRRDGDICFTQAGLDFIKGE